MKKIIAVASLIAMTACGTAQTTDSSIKSERASSEVKVAKYKKVVKLFDAMSESASSGPSLEFFGYKQDFWLSNDEVAKCKTTSARDVLKRMNVYSVAMFEDGTGYGAAQAELIDEAQNSLKHLVGKSDYLVCEQRNFIPYSIQELTYFIAKDGRLRLQFESAYED